MRLRTYWLIDRVCIFVRSSLRCVIEIWFVAWLWDSWADQLVVPSLRQSTTHHPCFPIFGLFIFRADSQPRSKRILQHTVRTTVLHYTTYKFYWMSVRWGVPALLNGCEVFKPGSVVNLLLMKTAHTMVKPLVTLNRQGVSPWDTWNSLTLG